VIWIIFYGTLFGGSSGRASKDDDGFGTSERARSSVGKAASY